jgi:hypothetical protein
MSPAMPRPATVRVLEAYEDERRQVHMWIRMGPAASAPVRYVILGAGAIEDRKLKYGFANWEIDLVEDGPPGSGHWRAAGTRRAVDTIPTADDDAFKALIAEILDKWERFGVDIRDPEEAPPPLPSTVPAAQRHPDLARWARRPDRERDFDPPAKAPTPRQPPVVSRKLSRRAQEARYGPRRSRGSAQRRAALDRRPVDREGRDGRGD